MVGLRYLTASTTNPLSLLLTHVPEKPHIDITKIWSFDMPPATASDWVGSLAKLMELMELLTETSHQGGREGGLLKSL